MRDFLITNIGRLVTLAPLAQGGRLGRVRDGDLGALSDAWLAVAGGRVVDYGTGHPAKTSAGVPRYDAGGGLVLPGLIDCHTHPVFAGDRANEFAMRLRGASYQEIAAGGGGIRSTVSATRMAGDGALVAATSAAFRRFLRWGVTTCEAKSGYGLSVAGELKLLRALKAAGRSTDQTISATCLALHAIPQEFTTAEAYVADVTANLLPVVACEHLARWVDAFIEQGYFSAAACAPYFDCAVRLGMGVRIHADEFSDCDGAATAAHWQAASADHLQYASSNGIKAMAAQGVVAVLLPGTSLYTAIPFTKARAFREAGCPIAVATDFNPGSCVLDNLPLAATMAAVHCGLTVPETIAAVTLVPAYALRLHHVKGALARGHDADLSIYRDVKSEAHWVADLGRTPPSRVFIRGREQYLS